MDKLEVIEIIDIDGRGVAITPEGYCAHDLSIHLKSPTRIERLVELASVKSLIDYTKRFRSAETSIYSKDNSKNIRVVFDHSSPNNPEWHGHSAKYEAKYSIEYSAWLAVCSKRSSLIDLARFLEQRRSDVVEPSGADMLALALNFKATRNASFSNQNNLRDGSVQFTYTEDNKSSGTIEVPETMTLHIPLFDKDDPQEVILRVSWKLDQGSVSFGFEIVNREQIERDRFDEIVDFVEEESGVSHRYSAA